ncbi:hypothetical protein Tco_0581595, partial [Tanacetum coccineum]
YHGVANVVAETAWLRNLLLELHAPLSTDTIVYCDNVSAVYLSTNPVQHQRTKHIEIDIHFIQDYVASGQTNTSYLKTLKNSRPLPDFEEYAIDTTLKVRPPIFTMEEYIRIEKKKLVGVGNVYNGNCYVYGKMLDNEYVHDLEFLTVSYFDDLDYFNDFEKEFPVIVYNDALTSKLDFLIEPTESPQHIDEFDLNDETSLSKCGEEEQNVLKFNDLFPFNVIYPNDSKSDKNNDDDKVDIKHSSGDMSVIPLSNVSIRRILGHGYGVLTSCTILGPRERNIDEYWWRIYKYGDLEVLES